MSYCASRIFVFLFVLLFLTIADDCPAAAINEQFSISGVIAGAYQYQDTDDNNNGRGGAPVQLEFAYTPDQRNTFGAKFGFASGNGLNRTTGFYLAPWAADLEDDVKDINGSGRDYLLTAWYMHTCEVANDTILSVAGGIIDATDYLDENAYANDEFTQFMNVALVNGPNGFLPSYDLGGAVRWEKENFSTAGVFMHINENDEGSSYNFYGLQFGYTLAGPTGEGTYRLILAGTSDEFLDMDGTGTENLKCAILSFDQQLGTHFGVWLRFGIQDDEAAIFYKNLYSGGLDVSGSLWGRELDNIGIGYAYLDEGNNDLETSRVLESYIRFGLNDYLAFTMDIQYMKDTYESSEQTDGFIYGIRVAAEF